MRYLIFISLMLLVPLQVQAACTTENCWRMHIFGFWNTTTVGGAVRNKIAITDEYEMKCSALRDLTNIGATILDGTINIEIWDCETDDATKQLIEADADYLILFGDQMNANNTWVETLRPRSEAITNPEFNAVRNFLVKQGFDSNGVDSCIGQNPNGRTRQEVEDDFLVCIGAI